MFQAGAVVPWSDFLLQLLTLAGGDLAPSVARDELDPPVSVGLSAREADGSAEEFPTGLALLNPLLLLKLPLDPSPLSPVRVGLIPPAPRLGPIVVLNLFGYS